MAAHPGRAPPLRRLPPPPRRLPTPRPAAPAVVKPAQLEARDTLRLALPSKGRMAEDTLQLLKVT